MHSTNKKQKLSEDANIQDEIKGILWSIIQWENIDEKQQSSKSRKELESAYGQIEYSVNTSRQCKLPILGKENVFLLSKKQ